MPGIEVDGKVDKTHIQKSWKQVAALNQIMMQVRSSGQLLAYQRGPALSTPGNPGGTVLTSSDAYRQLSPNGAVVAGSHGSTGLSTPRPYQRDPYAPPQGADMLIGRAPGLPGAAGAPGNVLR